MATRRFQLKFEARYETEKNLVSELQAWQRKQGSWQTLELDVSTPGFTTYVYSLLTCQHLYLRNSCAEKSLQMTSASGEILLKTNVDWIVTDVQAQFDIALRHGEASTEDIEYIISRLKQCPVSRNLPGAVDLDAQLHFSLKQVA